MSQGEEELYLLLIRYIPVANPNYMKILYHRKKQMKNDNFVSFKKNNGLPQSGKNQRVLKHFKIYNG
jgi:hypothetical protein